MVPTWSVDSSVANAPSTSHALAAVNKLASCMCFIACLYPWTRWNLCCVDERVASTCAPVQYNSVLYGSVSLVGCS